MLSFDRMNDRASWRCKKPGDNTQKAGDRRQKSEGKEGRGINHFRKPVECPQLTVHHSLFTIRYSLPPAISLMVARAVVREAWRCAARLYYRRQVAQAEVHNGGARVVQHSWWDVAQDGR